MTASGLFAAMKDDRIDRRLIRGELVERPYPFRCPAHAAVVANVSTLLLNWVKSASGGGWKAYGYGCPYRLQTNPDTIVYFDTSLVATKLDDSTAIESRFVDGLPTLAIEVLDMSDESDSIRELIEAAMMAGIPMFWMIDPFESAVDVYRPNCARTRFVAGEVIDADSVIPGFQCRVAEIFE